jgi:broad specificity phosphatase PhoE
MSAPLTIFLVRHGQVFNPENILYGRMPGYHLSELGREQAAAAGKYLSGESLDAIYSSPMERAQETAGLIIAAQKRPLTLQIDERLNEVHTPFDGYSHPDLEKIQHDIYTGTADEFEKPHDIRRRLLAFIADARQRHPSGKIAIVSHGDIVVSMFMYTHYQHENDIGRHRTDPDSTRLFQLGLPEYYPALASVSTLTFSTQHVDEVPAYRYHRPYA